MAPFKGNSIEQVAAVATPSPLAIAFPAGHAADSVAKQARAPTPGPVQANASSAGIASAGSVTGASPAALQAVIRTINAQLLTAGKSLALSVDAQSRHSIVVVRDTETGTIIQQIPSEEALRLASILGPDSHLLIDLTA